MDVTEKLRALRKRAGLSQQYMAREMGYKQQSSYRHYEDPNLFQQDAIPSKIVAKLAHILIGRAKKGEKPIAKEEVWALAGKLIVIETSQSEVEDSPETKVKKIPVLEWGQIMGWMDNLLSKEDIKEYDFSAHEDPGPKTIILVLTSDCMSGDMLFAGDKVVCDPSKPYPPGKIVIARVDGENQPVIGHYHRRRNQSGKIIIEIVPSNDAWPRYVIDDDHPGSIIGRVVEIRKAV